MGRYRAMRILELDLRTLALGALVCLAASALGQNGYTETSYTYSKQDSQNASLYDSFSVYAGADTTWTAQYQCHFTVTGAVTNDPPWRLVFSALCNNAWTDSQGFRKTFSQDGTVTDHQNFYTESGSEAFSPGNFTRSVDSHVVNYFWYDFQPIGTAPGGGGD